MKVYSERVLKYNNTCVLNTVFSERLRFFNNKSFFRQYAFSRYQHFKFPGFQRTIGNFFKKILCYKNTFDTCALCGFRQSYSSTHKRSARKVIGIKSNARQTRVTCVTLGTNVRPLLKGLIRTKEKAASRVQVLMKDDDDELERSCSTSD